MRAIAPLFRNPRLCAINSLPPARPSGKHRGITGPESKPTNGRPIAEIAMAIGTLAGLLDSCGFQDAGLQDHWSAFGLLKFSAAIATENESMDELFTAVMHARTLERDTDGEMFKWVRSVIEQWPEDSPYRKNAEELMDREVARKNGAKFEGDIETTHRQIHNN
jgi:hypothetical protein